MLRSWRTEAYMNKILDDLNIDGVMFVSRYYQWEPKIALGAWEMPEYEHTLQWNCLIKNQ